MRTAVIVPVKALGQVKSRLAPLLSLAERRHLAEIMLQGVLKAVGLLHPDIRKLVVTSYPLAMAMAEQLGMECLRETSQVSESHSVDTASAKLEAGGIEAVLRVPLDLPLVSAQALREVLARAEAGAAAVLVPSLDGTGTNAVYRRPPTLFPSRFGPGSLALHEQSLWRLGVPYTILELPALALDLDDAADVEALLERAEDCPAAAYLREIGATGRLAEVRKAGA